MIGDASAPARSGTLASMLHAGRGRSCGLALGAARRWSICRRSSPGFSLRTTRPCRIAISRSLLRRASISSTRPAGCICARSCTAWRAPSGLSTNTRKIGAASTRYASSFEALRTGLPASSTATGICSEPTAPLASFCSALTTTGGICSPAFFYGGQISLFAGLLGAGLSLGVGMLLGGLAGFYGAWVDDDHHARGGAVPRAAVVVPLVRGSGWRYRCTLSRRRRSC